MKNRAFLRRSIPLVLLSTLLLSMVVPASAFLFGKSEEAIPTVAAFSKNGAVTGVLSFTADDFKVEDGKMALDSIVLTALPDGNAGVLTLGGQPLNIGDTVAMSAVSGMRFTPLSVPTVSATAFSFAPVFSGGQSGGEVSVGLYLLAAENGAPIAENLSICTYKNVAITCRFAATDPEGDLLTYQLVDKPARGAVTLPEAGSSEFIYTPYENKTGKDTFTYVAVDAVGNSSAPATVKVKIEKANTKVTYADMDGVPAHKAAIRLAERDLFVGECMGGAYFFSPDTPVSRSAFVAMAMNAAGVEALEGVERTGFADDVTIPTWAKAYVSSALKSGLVQGTQDESGQIVFNAEAPITRGEAAVLLNRVLQVSDVSAETLYADSASVPTWAYQSAVNLETCGVLQTDASGALALASPLTRGDAAELLCGALDVLENRESGGWFNW